MADRKDKYRSKAPKRINYDAEDSVNRHDEEPGRGGMSPLQMERMLTQMKAEVDRLSSRPDKEKRVKIKPPKFDGSGSLLSFLSQFEVAANRNMWSPAEKTDVLKSVLTGSCSQILWDLGSDSEFSYEDIVNRLLQRYGSKGQTEVYRGQLQDLLQKWDR